MILQLPLFRIGLISDIQYADVDDTHNFNKSNLRYYRNTLSIVDRSVQHFIDHEVDLVIQAGDIIDAKNRSHPHWPAHAREALAVVTNRLIRPLQQRNKKEKKNDHLHKPHDPISNAFFQDSEALDMAATVAQAPVVSSSSAVTSTPSSASFNNDSDSSSVDFVHLIGNHELYNFTRDQLTQHPSTLPDGFTCAKDGSTYYVRPLISIPIPEATNTKSLSLSPSSTASGTQCSTIDLMVLDAYDYSCIRDGGGRHGVEFRNRTDFPSVEAFDLCQANNPNPIGEKVNFFQGIRGEQSRWVPFNGGFTQAQLDFIEANLQKAAQLGSKFIVACHVILHPQATPGGGCKTLLWNYHDFLHLVEKYPNTVPLVISGHAHAEIYHFHQPSATHFLTLPSPLNISSPSGDCCAIAELYLDRIFIRGFGDVSNRTLIIHHDPSPN